MSLRLLPMEIPFFEAVQGSSPQPLRDGGESIGRSWQESTFELGAIVIETSSDGVALSGVRHIARRDLAVLATHSNGHRAGGTTYIEVLAAGEWITRVDFRFGSHHNVVALRLRTNQSRVSQWIGSVSGHVDTVEAPSGFAINAVVATCLANGRCWPLGVLCCPLSMVAPVSPSPRTCELVAKSHAYGAALRDGKQRPFEEVVDTRGGDTIRAIVVRCDFHVVRVWVLSSTKWDVFETFKGRGPLGRDEFCLELAPDEAIVRVDIQSHEVVNAVRFATSQQRETAWWGRAAFGSVTRVACSGGDGGRTFAGLYGTLGDNFVGALGVAFAPLVETEDLTNTQES